MLQPFLWKVFWYSVHYYWVVSESHLKHLQRPPCLRLLTKHDYLHVPLSMQISLLSARLVLFSSSLHLQLIISDFTINVKHSQAITKKGYAPAGIEDCEVWGKKMQFRLYVKTVFLYQQTCLTYSKPVNITGGLADWWHTSCSPVSWLHHLSKATTAAFLIGRWLFSNTCVSECVCVW